MSLAPSLSTRNVVPVTVPAAPRNVSAGAGICDHGLTIRPHGPRRLGA